MRRRTVPAVALALLLMLMPVFVHVLEGQYVCPDNRCELGAPDPVVCNQYCGTWTVVVRTYYVYTGNECYQGYCWHASFSIFDPPPRSCQPGVSVVCNEDEFDCDGGFLWATAGKASVVAAD